MLLPFRWPLVLAVLIAARTVYGVPSRGVETSPAVFDGTRWVPVTNDGNGAKPPPALSDSWKRSETSIFIGIAAYRDKRCGKTLYNYYTKAEYPDRVSIGLVQQIASDDVECISTYCELMGAKDRENCPHVTNIRQVVVSNLEAKGPCIGRHLQSLLQQQGDEEFCVRVPAPHCFCMMTVLCADAN
jgi:hypothetical protein